MAVSFPQLDVYYIDFSKESNVAVGKLEGLGEGLLKAGDLLAHARLPRMSLMNIFLHLAAVHVDIHTHIGDVNAPKDDLTAGGVFHTVEAAQERTLAASGRTENADDIALVDGDVDALEDFLITEVFLQVNYVDHFFSDSFPSA